VLIDALAVLGFERWHAIDDRYTLDVLDRLLQLGIERGELRPMPSTRTMARIIVGATNEAALFVAHSADPGVALTEACDAFDLIFEGLAAA
jgi:hypothetical protein